MSHLLIRTINLKLKRRLAASARRSGRSLSEEAKALIDCALAETKPARGLGTALVERFRVIGPVDLRDRAVEAPRRPPYLE